MRTLQQQLKSKDEKIRNSSANCLMRFWMARMRYQSARQKLQKKEKTASTPINRPAVKVPSVPNTDAPNPDKAAALPVKAPAPPTPTPPVKKPFSGPTISSDEVLKWLNDKKVTV